VRRFIVLEVRADFIVDISRGMVIRSGNVPRKYI
jgi:hypothetical protein